MAGATRWIVSALLVAMGAAGAGVPLRALRAATGGAEVSSRSTAGQSGGSAVESPGGSAAGLSGGSAAAEQRGAIPAGMAAIPAGRFIPLYAVRDPDKSPRPEAVPGFLLDATPVTNAEYLAFVRAHPRWQRSQVPRLFAEGGYLEHWAGDLELGGGAPPGSPVTRVSWFAAKAYCAEQGRRLPSTAQWEYAAAAGATVPDATEDPAFLRMILDWYGRPNPERLPPVGRGFRNLWGVYDLHGLVWEWTLDFNTALVTGESRADTALERNLFCGSGAVGAANFRDYAAFMRYGFRASLSADYVVATLGFRCAAGAS
jgi:formylglycine-generating enzyme required for sulfatase activity